MIMRATGESSTMSKLFSISGGTPMLLIFFTGFILNSIKILAQICVCNKQLIGIGACTNRAYVFMRVTSYTAAVPKGGSLYRYFGMILGGIQFLQG
jgi:hypothetical protein